MGFRTLSDYKCLTIICCGCSLMPGAICAIYLSIRPGVEASPSPRGLFISGDREIWADVVDAHGEADLSVDVE